VSWPRVFASVVASAIGLAFWWALTEPLPVPPTILLGVAAAILFCAGLIAGRGGAVAAPVALLFSLFVGSIIATQLHQAFRPETTPIDEFNGLVSLHFPEVLAPLAIAVVVGALGGLLGERLLPSQGPSRR
jgi:Na+/melibiose symporter-like transporter